MLQGVGLCASAIGVLVSAWLTREAWADARSVAGERAIERLVACSHVRVQLALLVTQLGFAATSVLVLFLPPVSSAMAVYPGGPYVLTVIVSRKLIRAALILLLCGSAIWQAHDRRRLLRRLRHA